MFEGLGGSASFASLPLWLWVKFLAPDGALAVGFLLVSRRLRQVHIAHRWHGKASSLVLFVVVSKLRIRESRRGGDVSHLLGFEFRGCEAHRTTTSSASALIVGQASWRPVLLNATRFVAARSVKETGIPA